MVTVASSLLIGVGALLAIASLIADMLGFGGTAGLGWRQLVGLVVGLAMIVVGLVVSAPRRQAVAGAWTRAASLRPGQFVLVCVWFGLVIGIVEVVHLGTRKLALGAHLGLPVHMVWMTPTCYVLVLLAVGFLGAGLAKVFASRFKLVVVIFALSAIAAWSQALVYIELEVGAMVILCLAVAFQITRTVAAKPEGFLQFARRSVAWMAGLVVVAGLAVPVSRTWAEQEVLSGLPAPRQGAPNVVLITLDTVRARNLKLYGYDRPSTPNIDALAAEGILFERMITTAPWTLPSHSTMFTGRYGFEHGADFRDPLDDKYPTLAEILNGEGYATAGFIGNLIYCSREYGLSRGFSHYEDWYVNPVTLGFCASILRTPALKAWLGTRHMDKGRNDAKTLTDGFLSWLDSVEKDRPFFAFINYFDAHSYYLPPEYFQNKMGPPSKHVREWASGTRKWPKEDIQGFLNGYDGGIAYIDDQIGKIVEKLRELGELDNTLLVMTSDHGELFGEHGLIGHTNSLYDLALHVPLVVSYPGKVPPGQRVTEYVSMRDLPATILDMIDVTEHPIPGHSLTDLWRTDYDPTYATHSPVLSEVSKRLDLASDEPYSKGDMKSLTQDGLHYILNGDQTEELYDLRVDPLEVTDLMKTPAGEQRVVPLRRALQEVLASGGN